MNEENKEDFTPEQNAGEVNSEGQPRGPYSYGVPPNIPHMTPPPPEKARRVGTMTMGISLIAAGIAALLALLFPSNFDIVFILRLSPLVLVVLGLEIILNFIIFKGQKLKYDFLSGFVCFLLIMGCLFAAAVPALMQYSGWGPRHNEMANSIQHSTDQYLAEQLADVSVIQSARTDVYLQRSELEYKVNSTYTDLLPSDHVGLNITLKGDYKDSLSFATACRPVLDRLQALPLEFDYVSLYYYDNSAQLNRFELNIDNPFAWKQDAASLATLVDSSESERRELEKERAEMYSDLESEREEMLSQMESERSELSEERAEMNSQFQSDREEMNSQLQSEREEMARNATQ